MGFSSFLGPKISFFDNIQKIFIKFDCFSLKNTCTNRKSDNIVLNKHWNREKIVFLAPLNWDFLPLPGLA